jgi:hypothetical protein
MNSLDTFIGSDGPMVGRPVPIFIYENTRFGTYYVAEPDSSRPAHYAGLLRFLRRDRHACGSTRRSRRGAVPT